MDSSSHDPATAKILKEKNKKVLSDGCHAEKQMPNMDDAVAFMRSLEARYGVQSETYKEFIRLLSRYQSGSIEIESVIATVKVLLGGHSDLISGFSTFLPREWKITDELHERSDKCISFLNKLKDRFPNDENCIYSSVVRMIMSLSQDRSISLHQVCEEVAALFSSHLDLLEEFRELLPDAYRKSRCSGGDDVAPRAAPLSAAISAKRVNVDGSNHGRKRQHARNERTREYSPPLDTSKLEQCTPSYRILPKNYKFPVASYMSEMDKSVLNDTVVLASKRKR